MPKLIKDGIETANAWNLVDRDSELSVALENQAEQLLVPFPMWQAHKATLKDSDKEIGVWLDSEDDPYELVQDISELSLIAVNFPVFRDGRSFSTAAILRERLTYRGELRAIGDVLRDQMFYMKKCGINSFEIPDSLSVEDALAAFADFSDNYQSTIENPEPLFRRRQD